MPIFKYPANVIHNKYGIMRYAAFFEIFEKAFIVNKMRNHNTTSQINEKRYSCK